MPARKNPVINLKISNADGVKPVKHMPKLITAAIMAQAKKTFEDEKRSDMLSTANNNVPTINPDCTALVKWAK